MFKLYWVIYKWLSHKFIHTKPTPDTVDCPTRYRLGPFSLWFKDKLFTSTALVCTSPKSITQKKSHFLNKNYMFHKDPWCSSKGKPPWRMWFERRRFKQAHLELNLGLLFGGGAVFWLDLVGMECTPSTGKKGHIVPVSAAQPQTASKSWGQGGREGGRACLTLQVTIGVFAEVPSYGQTHTRDNQHDCSGTIVRWGERMCFPCSFEVLHFIWLLAYRVTLTFNNTALNGHSDAWWSTIIWNQWLLVEKSNFLLIIQS